MNKNLIYGIAINDADYVLSNIRQSKTKAGSSMKAQHKTTGEVFDVFALRPGRLILSIEGREIEVNDDLYKLEIETHLYCNCEQQKIDEHTCPLDNDTCNCCAYCERQCMAYRQDESNKQEQ